jgi:hypothetical protein
VKAEYWFAIGEAAAHGSGYSTVVRGGSRKSIRGFRGEAGEMGIGGWFVGLAVSAVARGGPEDKDPWHISVTLGSIVEDPVCEGTIQHLLGDEELIGYLEVAFSREVILTLDLDVWVMCRPVYLVGGIEGHHQMWPWQ